MIQPRLEEAAARVWFDPSVSVQRPYVVQPGDRLESIARRYRVGWQSIATVNGISPERLPVGGRLKVARGPVSVIIEKSRFCATAHVNGYYLASWPVAIGRFGRTPSGRFVVAEKVLDPAWHGRDQTIAADDPSNPLGEHWIGLDREDGSPSGGLGLHGTINPASIGTAASGGCVRLHPSDIEQLFGWLVPGSAVEIRD